jgi:nitronate monooxygenase
VSNGGGLGLVEGGRGDWQWLDRELAVVVERTDKPWGVGFLSWSVDASVVRRALEYGAHAVMLSFGDPRPLAEPVLEAGVAADRPGSPTSTRRCKPSRSVRRW